MLIIVTLCTDVFVVACSSVFTIVLKKLSQDRFHKAHLSIVENLASLQRCCSVGILISPFGPVQHFIGMFGKVGIS